VTPEHINFMITHGRGLVCMPMSKARCEQLDLRLMVQPGPGRVHQTYFTESIEAATGVSTGISIQDRAHTIRVAAKPDAKPLDLVRPGHIFPIMAQPGGVLVRNGHTEASTDLAMLAGYEPAAVIIEILNEDGTMARRPDLEKLAIQHDLKIGTIADLVQYRLEHQA
jgi:3,4-dihydroxy 2-butanone 4-phosphate synthase/GTP cyclohydrolase II